MTVRSKYYKYDCIVHELTERAPGLLELVRDRGTIDAVRLRIDQWEGELAKVGSEYAIPCRENGEVLRHLTPLTAKPEKSGGSVDYYRVRIENPTSGGDKYTAECNDIIEALGMNYAEGNAFKAIWRSCAARTLGKLKEGGDALYDAEKVAFFGKRMIEQRKGK